MAYFSALAMQPGGCIRVAFGIADSQESRALDVNVRRPIQLTHDLYHGLLGRPVESQEAIDYWVRINMGYGRINELSGIIYSPEFASRCRAYGLN